jgi:RimJ/RimL family protein N-acetyltransferase
MSKIIELETERLVLRQWRPADREPFAALNADPRVMEFFPATMDRRASDVMADRCEALIAERGWGFWAVEVKQSGRFIGYVGLHIPAAELPFSPCVEVGWRIARNAWGKGYATEAARSALEAGFAQLELPEIVSFTALGNHRSRAVMQRLGMREDAHTFDHPSVAPGHPLRRHCLYRLARELWLSSCRPASSPIDQS